MKSSQQRYLVEPRVHQAAEGSLLVAGCALSSAFSCDMITFKITEKSLVQHTHMHTHTHAHAHTHTHTHTHTQLVDLPCLTECHKTLDKRTVYKTGDVSQILVCSQVSHVKCERTDNATRISPRTHLQLTRGLDS